MDAMTINYGILELVELANCYQMNLLNYFHLYFTVNL